MTLMVLVVMQSLVEGAAVTCCHQMAVMLIITSNMGARVRCWRH